MCAVGLLELRRVAGELLPERERSGILQVRAADLDDVARTRSPCAAKRRVQRVERRPQIAHDRFGRGNVHRGGKTSFDD